MHKITITDLEANMETFSQIVPQIDIAAIFQAVNATPVKTRAVRKDAGIKCTKEVAE